jgi:hypothetical protein
MKIPFIDAYLELFDYNTSICNEHSGKDKEITEIIEKHKCKVISWEEFVKLDNNFSEYDYVGFYGIEQIDDAMSNYKSLFNKLLLNKKIYLVSERPYLYNLHEKKYKNILFGLVLELKYINLNPSHIIDSTISIIIKYYKKFTNKYNKLFDNLVSSITVIDFHINDGLNTIRNNYPNKLKILTGSFSFKYIKGKLPKNIILIIKNNYNYANSISKNKITNKLLSIKTFRTMINLRCSIENKQKNSKNSIYLIKKVNKISLLHNKYKYKNLSYPDKRPDPTRLPGGFMYNGLLINFMPSQFDREIIIKPDPEFDDFHDFAAIYHKYITEIFIKENEDDNLIRITEKYVRRYIENDRKIKKHWWRKN